MTTQTSILQPVARQSWLSGFKNLLWNENNRNWGGRRWIVPAAVSLAVINGLVLLLAAAGPSDPSLAQEDLAVMAVSVFFEIGMIVTALAVVIKAQGAIIGEKQLGTAAWVLSKPTSRSAFIVAKWLGYSIASLVLSIGIPAILFVIQSKLFWDQTPTLIRFVQGLLIMVLHLLFYLGLSLMLGTLFNSRGPVAGISISVLLAGTLLPTLFPQWISIILPWMLPKVATGIVLGQRLPSVWPVPILVNVVWVLLFFGIAVWRFKREEF